MTPSEQAAFAARWGELRLMPTPDTRLDHHPAVIEIDFRGAKPTTDIWHTDMSMDERPSMATFLLARHIPPAGRYDIRQSVSRLRQPVRWHEGDAGAAEHRHDGAKLGPAARLDPEKLPTSVHPMVRTHPETGRKALYVSAIFTRRFDKMTAEESAPLLNWLLAHCCQPNFTFRHRWSVGDLVMWDNRCVQHFAVADYDSAQRTMNRGTVVGDRPH